MRASLSATIATLALLVPVTTFAELYSPAEVLTVLQESATPRSFSANLNGNLAGMKVSGSFWGLQKGTLASDLNASTTMNVTATGNGMTIRLAGEIRMVDGISYVKISTLDTKYQDQLSTLNMTLGQRQWMMLPVDGVDSLGQMQAAIPVMLGTLSSSMIMKTTALGQGYRSYTLELSPEAAATIASALTSLVPNATMQATAPTASLKIVATTDANDVLTSSSIVFRWKAGVSSLGFDASSKRTSTVAVKAPTGAVSMDSLMGMQALLGNLQGISEKQGSPLSRFSFGGSMEGQTPEPLPSTTPAINCVRSPTSTLVGAQRSGECPIEKVSRRRLR